MGKQVLIPPGTSFEWLTTVSDVFSDGTYRSKVRVQCICGVTKTVATHDLLRGDSKSCGCRRRSRRGLTTSGGIDQVLYTVWSGINNRCYNPNQRGYRYYGAKGVTVCTQWRADPVAFITWSKANGYHRGLEIDRRDSELPYSPDNCQWVTKKQNLRNRSFCWDDEIEARLQSYARAQDVSPYEVIRAAVAQYLNGED